MAGRTDAAYAGYDPRQLLDGSTNDESLEATQFRDLKKAIPNAAVVAEKDFNLAMTF
jgi:hypothetical protein